MGQQFRVLGKHPVVIISRNFQVGPQLAMGNLVNLQRFHFIPLHIEVHLIAAWLHLKFSGIYQKIGFLGILAGNLRSHFL